MLYEKTLKIYMLWLQEMLDKLDRYTAHIQSYEEFCSDEKNLDLALVPLI
jgi:hypothetical protein